MVVLSRARYTRPGLSANMFGVKAIPTGGGRISGYLASRLCRVYGGMWLRGPSQPLPPPGRRLTFFWSMLEHQRFYGGMFWEQAYAPQVQYIWWGEIWRWP